MKKLIFTVAWLIVTGIFAQIQQPRNDSFNELVFFVGTNNPEFEKAEGSRYLNADFVPARVNQIRETQLVRFNVVENAIEVKKGSEQIMTLSTSYKCTITLLDGSDKTYETLSFRDETGSTKTTFFEKIYKADHFSLYLKERIQFIPAKPEKSSYEKAVPAKFVKGNEIFYVIGLESNPKGLTELPKKKKDFLKVLGNSENSKKVEKMIKEKNQTLEIRKTL
jgi:hypothetical protein